MSLICYIKINNHLGFTVVVMNLRKENSSFALILLLFPLGSKSEVCLETCVDPLTFCKSQSHMVFLGF